MFLIFVEKYLFLSIDSDHSVHSKHFFMQLTFMKGADGEGCIFLSETESMALKINSISSITENNYRFYTCLNVTAKSFQFPTCRPNLVCKYVTRSDTMAWLLAISIYIRQHCYNMFQFMGILQNSYIFIHRDAARRRAPLSTEWLQQRIALINHRTSRRFVKFSPKT